MMSDRNTVLKQLKDDLKEYITSSRTSSGGRRYKTSPVEIKRGIHGSNDFTYKPVLCFTCYKDEVENEFGTYGTRWLYIYLYGYDDVSRYRDDDDAYDAIHDLAQDVEEFLYNDFTYSEDVMVGDFICYEAGTNLPVTFFEVELRIKYDYSI